MGGSVMAISRLACGPHDVEALAGSDVNRVFLGAGALGHRRFPSVAGFVNVPPWRCIG